VHSREGDKFNVEIMPAYNIREVQENANDLVNQVEKELANYAPDEYLCHGDFDAFGEWYSKYHDTYCRKGIPVDDFCDHSCDIELLMEYKWQRDRIRRHYDFLSCFKNPSKASTVFPLTSGRVMRSCIHDRE
jgi:fructosamine-3-kinase